MFLRHRPFASLLPMVIAMVPAPALAGGFYLQEQSPKETGRALSGGAAAADDPSIVYFNPAAMTALPGMQMSMGGVLLSVSAGQNNLGTTRTVPGSPGEVAVSGGSGGKPFASLIAVPSVHATAQVTDRLWLGVGVTAPFGLKLDYDEDFFGRYDSLHTELKTYNVQPSAAFKLTESLSIGGGVDVQYVKVVLTNALPNLSPIATDGHARMEGDDLSIGWNAGLFYHAGDTQVGLHYRSGMKHRIEGLATLSDLQGPLAALNGTSDLVAPLHLPDIATVSVMRRLTPRARAMVTARWYNWSVFQAITITSGTGTSVKPVRYRDSYSVSAGGEYDVSPRLTLRAGTMFDRTPTNPQYLTTRVPDGDRVWLSGGATWNMSSSLALNLSYAHNFIQSVTINRPDHYYAGGAAVTTTTRSRAGGNVDQIAASVTARF